MHPVKDSSWPSSATLHGKLTQLKSKPGGVYTESEASDAFQPSRDDTLEVGRPQKEALATWQRT